MENTSSTITQSTKDIQTQATKDLSKSISPNNTSSKRTWDRLYVQAVHQQQKMEEKRKSTPEGCTFSPRLTKKSIDLSKNSPHGISRFESLYKNAELKNKKIEQVCPLIQLCYRSVFLFNLHDSFFSL